MKSTTVKMVRIYITESSKLLDDISVYLKKEAQIPGFTVFRGIAGYGESGTHTTGLLDLSLDLPLVIEFFATPKKSLAIIKYLNNVINPKHIVSWNVKIVSEV